MFASRRIFEMGVKVRPTSPATGDETVLLPAPSDILGVPA